MTLDSLSTDTPPPVAAGFSARQDEVLESALRLLVEGGERALTTAAVARAANCSKESLYRWFGDRDGLLAAMIAHQAAKVRVPEAGRAAAGLQGFRADLEVFAADLLGVLAGEVSIALNRLAIGQAAHDGARLGRLVLERGRRPIDDRARRLLAEGAARGFLDPAAAGDAYRDLYGLIVGDLHVRLLLGDGDLPPPAERTRLARRAIDQFFRLHGAAGKAATGNDPAA